MPVLAGTPSVAALSTLQLTDWWLKDALDSTYDRVVSVISWAPSYPVTAGVFYPRRDPDAVDNADVRAVVVQGPIYGGEGNLVVRALDEATYTALMARFLARRTMLLQDVLGRQWYVRVGPGRISEQIVRAQPTILETSPIRHAFELTVPLIVVRAP